MDLVDDLKLNQIIKSFIEEYGFVNHIISSMNDAYSMGIPVIISDQYIINEVYRPVMEGKKLWTFKTLGLESVTLKVKATNVDIKKPTIFANGHSELSYPNKCQKEERLYGSHLEIEFYIELEAVTTTGKVLKKEPVVFKSSVGRLPTVVFSNRCNLENKTIEELDRLEEDPNEFGGYIVNGSNRYLIDSVERTNAFNRVNTYYEGKHGNLLVWSNIISKPGIAYENSNEIVLRMYITGEINILINKDYFKIKEIPFFMIFRLFGVTSDADIVRYILKDSDIDADYNKNLLNYLIIGFNTISKDFEDLRNVYDPLILRNKLAGVLVKSNNKIKVEYEMFDWLDANFLPHMGITKDDRFKKLLFIGYMIKKTFLVAQDPTLNTNRDQLEEKLVQPPGTLFCDTFKTLYNKHFIMQIKKKFKEKLKQTEFGNIHIKDIFDIIVSNTKLESKLITTLSSGIKDADTSNSRYSTQKLYNNPDINRLNASRTIRVASSGAHKQKNRSHAVRESKPSYAGYIDMTMSHDTGNNVGKIKGLGIMCLITNRGDLSIKDMLLKDIFVVDKTHFNLNLISNKGEVFLNGELLGYHDNICVLRNKYIQLRRQRVIDRFTGIHCHITFNNIDFRTDASRLIRPFVIVYNNFGDDTRGLDDEKLHSNDVLVEGKFKQYIKFTLQHYNDLLEHKITIDDLVDEGILEWIDCREFVYTTYVANSLETLIENETNHLQRFTHCDFMCAIYGIACLTQRFANHNPNVRTCFQAKMVKQTLGIPTLERNPVYSDQWRQAINSNPLTTTIINEYITPSGYMIMLAIMSYYGHNQEDSLIANQRTMDRGLYYVIVDDILEYKIEPNENILNPDDDVVASDPKFASSYGKLVNGLIAKGTTITHGDILISKRIPNKRTNSKTDKKYTDKSIRYMGTHDQLVLNVFDIVNESTRYIKIQVRERRPLRIGDKMSSSCFSPDHQILTTDGWIDIDKVTMNHSIACLKKNGTELTYMKPIGLIDEPYKGKMYKVKSDHVNLKVTPNHKLWTRGRIYTKKRGGQAKPAYKIKTAEQCFGKTRCYKKNADVWNSPNMPDYFPLSGVDNLPELRLDVNAWSMFYGVWIAEGCVSKHSIKFAAMKPRVQRLLTNCMRIFSGDYSMNNPNIDCYSKSGRKYVYVRQDFGELSIFKTRGESGNLDIWYIKDKRFVNLMNRWSEKSINKYLPKWVWQLTREQCRFLIDGMCYGDGHKMKEVGNENQDSNYPEEYDGTVRYDTSSTLLADDFQRLCLHAGWACNKMLKYEKGHISQSPKSKMNHVIQQNVDSWRMTIIVDQVEPEVNKWDTKKRNGKTQDKWTPYDGRVYCVKMPTDHKIVYVRRKGRPYWVLRSGQKGIISKVYPNHLMPFTDDGITPDFIMGPHAFPSRKTIGQLLEGLYSSWNALTGIISDHTVFNKIDIHAMMENIKTKNVLIDRRIMYNGITGERLEVPIVLIPNYYQRIHKSIYDSHYSIYWSAIDEQTRQASQGQKNRGGVRFGEMETQASAVSGACSQLKELSTDCTDGFITYACRCGSRDTVVNEREGIYSCLRCTKPSIVKLNDSYTSNLVNNNLTGMNIKLTYDLK